MAKKSQVAKTERLNAKPVLKARVKNRCNRSVARAAICAALEFAGFVSVKCRIRDLFPASPKAPGKLILPQREYSALAFVVLMAIKY